MIINRIKSGMNFPRLFAFSTFTLIPLLTEISALPNTIYGATVHWRPSSNDKIIMSYILFWEQHICAMFHKTLQNCQDSFLTTTTSISAPMYFRGYSWRCRSGCYSSDIVANLSRLYFTDIGTFHEIGYEGGTETSEFTFGPSDDLANIRLGFEKSAGILVEGLGECHLSMAVRNDTRRPNISPLMSVFPVNRVPLGCSIDVSLFPFDGDGDYVKCHWEAFPKTSDKEYRAILNEDLCSIHVQADTTFFHAGDQLKLSLYAEDYSRISVQFSGVSNHISSGPFSRTPLKLLIYIGDRVASCNNNPAFGRQGTLPMNYKHSYMLPFKYALVKLPFETYDHNTMIMTTGPRYMKFEERRNTTTIKEGVWNNLTDTSMNGIHHACGQAYTDDGVPGESRCAVLMVNEPDECESRPCQRTSGGVCDNLFEYYTCSYPDTPSNVLNRSTGACESSSDNQTEKTTKQTREDIFLYRLLLVAALFLLLLLIVIMIAVCLIHKYKQRNPAVHPSNNRQRNETITNLDY